MASKLGLSGKLYYLSTGTRATWGTANGDGIHEGAAPSNLTELSNVTNVTLNLSKGQAEASTRGSGGWRQRKSTLKDGTISFEMNWDEADAGFAAIFKAWLNNSSLAIAALSDSKSTANTTGFWADFEVFDFNKTEPLEEVQKVAVTLMLCPSAVAPEWVKVTGS